MSDRSPIEAKKPLEAILSREFYLIDRTTSVIIDCLSHFSREVKSKNFLMRESLCVLPGMNGVVISEGEEERENVRDREPSRWLEGEDGDWQGEKTDRWRSYDNSHFVKVPELLRARSIPDTIL